MKHVGKLGRVLGPQGVEVLPRLVGEGQHPLRGPLTDHLRDDEARVIAVEGPEHPDIVCLVAVVEFLVEALPQLGKEGIEHVPRHLHQTPEA